jgi:rare lipoprotein A
MRPKLSLRMTRRGRLMAGAMITTIPTAITAAPTLAANLQTQTAVPSQVSAHRVAFNHPVVVTGSLSSVDAGHRVQLQFQPAGRAVWQWLTSTTVDARGHYRLAAPLRRSGYVRVVDLANAGAPVPLVHAREASTPSAVERVAVDAALRVTPRGHDALSGQHLSLSGRLLPELAGRVVKLERRRGSRWTPIASARTGRHGGFTLRFSPAYGTHSLRVRFAGDRANARAVAFAGTATGFEQSVASWYDDAGTTGCGFHATYGVANKSLPCGTHVTLRYGARTVVATVDDRGPYVGGRTWDLNQNTAAALGFAGVATVWDAY